MVNYCCVTGCGRNSRQNKQLNYYSLPKERNRQKEWLRVAGREDILDKEAGKLTVSYRFCSRHFAPSSIKNRNLCADAVPSLCLPGSQSEDEVDSEDLTHTDVICDSCAEPVIGFRYKCVMCQDYDLCPKCEMKETHAQHFMLRIPHPVKFNQADNLVKKWRELFNSKHATPDTLDDSDSSDDEPITKYAKMRQSTINTDISEDIKRKIQGEITRVLNLNLGTTDCGQKKRKIQECVTSSKKAKREPFDETAGNDIEVVFADVNQLNSPFMDSPMS